MFVGALVFVGLAFALRHHGAVAVVVLPLSIVVLLGGSVLRGRGPRWCRADRRTDMTEEPS